MLLLQSRLEQGTSTVPVPVPAWVPAAQTAAVAQWDHQPGTGVSFAPAWEDGDAGLALPDTRADWVTRAIADPRVPHGTAVPAGILLAPLGWHASIPWRGATPEPYLPQYFPPEPSSD